MKCPVDKSPLMVVERNQIELDFCPVCRGIWFDAEELHLLTDAMNLPVDIPELNEFPKAKSKEKTRRSPRSRKRMEKINMGTPEHPILIDRDPLGLGLWFDGGELEQVLRKHKNDHTESGEIFNFLGETFHV